MAAFGGRVMFTCIFIVVFSLSFVGSHRKFHERNIKQYRDRVVRMFQHAYNGYLNYAYPYDELQPLTCDGHDTWGGYSLTLVDALDTLAIMGNYSEFRRVADILISTLDFDRDINVSVFETNIRVVGGLVSAHLLAHKAGMQLEPGWPCSGPLLRMAETVARKLLPAFNTSTGMPYGTVNLRHGVPNGETTITCTAGVGTFLVEFGTLSKLTGDPVFERTAMRAMEALWENKSPIGLLGNHIQVDTGKWSALDTGIGAGVDSYFEYMVKGSILFGKYELMEQFHEYVEAIEKYLKREDWYMWAHMKKGTVTLPIFQSLEAFWPGLQSLVGDIDKAMKTLHNYHQIWKQYGFTPEFYNIPKAEAQNNREGYPLRPELIESVMYLYQATKDPYLLQVGIDILEAIEHSTRTKCGYATVKDVRDHRLENRMESFFLAETSKYLYLLFDEDNFIHNTGQKGTIINTPNGECIIDAGGYVFNTEAHPVDSASLYCCSAERSHDQGIIQDFHDNIDLLALLDLVEPSKDIFFTKEMKKKSRRKSKLLKSSKSKLCDKARGPLVTTVTDNIATHQEGPQDQGLPSQPKDSAQVNGNSVESTKQNINEKERQTVESNSESNVPESSPQTQTTDFRQQTVKVSQDVSIDQAVDDLIKNLQDKIKVAKTITETKKTLEAASKSLSDLGLVSSETNKDKIVTTIKVERHEPSSQSAQTTSQKNEQLEIKISDTSKMQSDDAKPFAEVPSVNISAENEQSPEEELEEEGVCLPEDKEKEEILAADEEIEEEEKMAQNLRLLTCNAQSFMARWSLMGEMYHEV